MADAVEPAGPYLCANPAKRAAWRERLARFSPNRRIGLVWRGDWDSVVRLCTPPSSY